jgi:hypothetical protein
MLIRWRRGRGKEESDMKTGITMAAAALGLAAVGLLGTPASAQMLDQVQDMTNASYNMDATSLNWQQEILTGIAGQLVQVDVYANGAGSATFYLNDGSPWQGDGNNFEMLFTSTGVGWYSIDVTSANLVFDVGDPFVMGWVGGGTGLWMGGGYIDNGVGPYKGELWLNGSFYSNGGWDLAFRTWVIPAPGALALLSLAGLVAPRRRRT